MPCNPDLAPLEERHRHAVALLKFLGPGRHNASRVIGAMTRAFGSSRGTARLDVMSAPGVTFPGDRTLTWDGTDPYGDDPVPVSVRPYRLVVVRTKATDVLDADTGASLPESRSATTSILRAAARRREYAMSVLVGLGPGEHEILAVGGPVMDRFGVGRSTAGRVVRDLPGVVTDPRREGRFEWNGANPWGVPPSVGTGADWLRRRDEAARTRSLERFRTRKERVRKRPFCLEAAAAARRTAAGLVAQNGPGEHDAVPIVERLVERHPMSRTNGFKIVTGLPGCTRTVRGRYSWDGTDLTSAFAVRQGRRTAPAVSRDAVRPDGGRSDASLPTPPPAGRPDLPWNGIRTSRRPVLRTPPECGPVG